MFLQKIISNTSINPWILLIGIAEPFLIGPPTGSIPFLSDVVGTKSLSEGVVRVADFEKCFVGEKASEQHFKQSMVRIAK